MNVVHNNGASFQKEAGVAGGNFELLQENCLDELPILFEIELGWNGARFENWP